MPISDDDDDRPRRRRDDDDDDDRPRRRRRDEDDDARAEDDDRPRRRRRDEDDDDDDRDRPRKKKKGMSVWLILLIVFGVMFVFCVPVGIALLLPAVQKVREAAARQADQNNLKMLGIGYHSYHDVNGKWTGPYSIDPRTGQPNTGLSHRVSLLPFIEQASLYSAMDMSSAWDSPRNQPITATAIKTFGSPIDAPLTNNQTRYQAFVGPGTMYDPAKNPMRITDITDGLSNTIMLVTADDTVPWAAPKDIPYNPTGPVPTIGQKAFGSGTNVLMGDGSVRFVKKGIAPETMRALITRNGGEMVPFDF